MTPRDLPSCCRCGAPAPFGFHAPYGRTGPSLHACAEHREAAEAAWRGRYHLDARQPEPLIDARQPSLFDGGEA